MRIVENRQCVVFDMDERSFACEKMLCVNIFVGYLVYAVIWLLVGMRSYVNLLAT